MKNALERCGFPKWTFKRKKKKLKIKENELIVGKVSIPYISKLSENLARVFKRYNIETVHKPTTKLKSLICNKMKDKIEVLDKTGVVYYNNCSIHDNADYVGETGRVFRERLYEHRIIDHKSAVTAASLGNAVIINEPEPTQDLRRSKRNCKKRNYQTMDKGTNQILSEGNTEFSAHVATDVHEKEQLKYQIVYTENNWMKRGIKEAIAIKKLQPALNLDGGRHYLSSIYDDLIKRKVNINDHVHGSDTPNGNQSTEEDNRTIIEII